MPLAPSSSSARNQTNGCRFPLVFAVRAVVGFSLGRFWSVLRRVLRACCNDIGLTSGSGVRCDLQLSQEILAARRRPIRSDAHPHASLLGCPDLSGAAVEKQITQGRPDHGGAFLGHDLEVGFLERGTMDSGQRRRDGPLARLKLQAQEMVPAPLSRPSARCNKKHFFCLSRARKDSPSVVSTSAIRVAASGSSGSPVCSTLRMIPR
jgi:hypothetical protein